jgi:hypothetical protein
MNYRNVVLLLAFALVGSAAELSIGSAVLTADKPAVLNVTLASGGAALAGVQFEIVYDATALEVTVQAGPAATEAGKTLQSAPLQAGRRRVIIVGFNQNSIPDGVVATIQVSLKNKTAAVADSAVRIQGLVGTTGQGQTVAIAGQDGGVTAGPASRAK